MRGIPFSTYILTSRFFPFFQTQKPQHPHKVHLYRLMIVPLAAG